MTSRPHAEVPRLRSYLDTDVDALVELIDSVTAPERVITHSGVRRMVGAPGYDPRRDMVVLPAADGSLRGARDVRVTARGDEEPLILESWGVVHAETSKDTAVEELLDAAVVRAGRLLVEQGRQRGILQVRVGKGDVLTQGVFRSAGFALARDLISMERPSLGDLAEPELPEEITLRTYLPGKDDEAWVDAFNAAFSDHWGGFMGTNLQRWQYDVADPSFKPEVSLVACAGDVLVGFCHGRIDNELNALTGKQTGLIRYVGVTPAWRRRGLGAALTLAGLRALRDAGMERAVLGVDAENVTGARALYERFGFNVTGEQVMYRREITAVGW